MALFLLLPHPDSYGYENLIEINKLCGLAKSLKKNTTILNCDEVEKIIFGNSNYIEANTFVTTYQMANVYSKAASIYEIRIDDNAVDIQLGGEMYSSDLPLDPLNTKEELSQTSEIMGNTLQNTDLQESISDSKQEQNIKNEDEAEIVDNEIDEYIKSKNLIGQTEDLLYLLMKDETVLSTYVALQIAGNESFRSKYGFERLTKD